MELRILNHRRDDLADAALQFAVVGDGRAHCDFGGGDWRDAQGDQLCGIDQESLETPSSSPWPRRLTHLLSDEHKIARGAFVNSAFAHHDLGFHLGRRIIEVDGYESLPGRLFQIFQNRLVSRDCKKPPA